MAHVSPRKCLTVTDENSVYIDGGPDRCGRRRRSEEHASRSTCLNLEINCGKELDTPICNYDSTIKG
jgi:hypothetical protein